MRVETIESSLRKDWDAFVLSHPLSIAWQSFGWSEVVAKHYPLRFYPLAAIEEGGKLSGVLPLYRLLDRKGPPTLISVPFAVAGGIVATNQEAEHALLQHAIELAKTEQAERIVFKQYKRRIQGDLQTDENYYNRELDVGRAPDLIWDELADVNKEQIERARKLQPRLEFPSKDVGTFHELLLGHMHRSGIPCPSRAWIQGLVDSGMYEIALYHKGGQVVAATMTKEFKKTVSFPFSCRRPTDAQGSLFLYGLYWELILHFAEKGLDIVHSGRIPNTDETDAYRLGWGGTKYPYFNQYYPPSDRPTEFKRKRGWKRQFFSTGWRYLPRPVAGWLGPRITARYP